MASPYVDTNRLSGYESQVSRSSDAVKVLKSLRVLGANSNIFARPVTITKVLESEVEMFQIFWEDSVGSS